MKFVSRRVQTPVAGMAAVLMSAAMGAPVANGQEVAAADATADAGQESIAPGRVVRAQEGQQDTASEGGLQTITVSARKTSEDIIRTPVTLTALTEESLELKGIEDRRDLNRFTPGFKAAPQNTSSASRLINSYAMRGLGSVNLFWNGVPLNGGDIPEMLDLQRVEVLRGPQNAHFGRSTFSGAINFIPKGAGFDSEGYAEVDLGTYDNTNFKTGLQGTIVPDLLAGRIAADFRETGGQYENFGYGGTLGIQETKGVAGSVLFTPGSNLQVRGYGAYWRVDDGPNAISYFLPTDYTCNAGGAPAGTNNYFCGEISRPRPDRISQLTEYPDAVFEELNNMATSTTVGPGFIEEKNGLKRIGKLGQVLADYELPLGLTASLVLSYMENEAGMIFDYGSRFYTDPATFNPSITTYRFEDEYAEFRVQSDVNARFRGMVGVSYVDSAQNIESVISKSGINSVSFPPTVNYSKTQGVFGSVSYDLFEKLTATVEGRYQDDEVGRRTLVSGSWLDLSGSTYSFVPRFILQYHATDDLELFGSYSEGSRPGSLNTGFLSLTPDAQAQVLAQGFDVPRVVPEQKLENIELGIKGNFLNNTLRVLGAVYYAEWTRQPNGAGLFYVNAQGVLAQANVLLGTGATDAQGTEWELVWAPNDNLSLDATFAYNNAEIVSTVCASCRAITGNLNPTGTQPGRFPEQTASLGVTYRHPSIRDFDAYYRVDANYQGKEYADDTNVVWLAPYVLSNARVGLRNDRYKFELYGLNLLDNHVPQSISQTTEQIQGRQTITVTPPLKRMFGVRASVSF